MASLNFKNAALAVAVGAVALTGGLPSKARADEPAITLQTDCQTYKPGVFGASAQCQKEKLRLSKEALQASQAKGRELEKKEFCIDTLVKFKSENPDAWKVWVADKKDAIKQDPCSVVAALPKKTAAVGQSAVLRQ